MNAVVKAENPFGTAVAHAGGANAIADTEQQRAIAEIQAAMVIAKKFPRDQVAAMDKILTACTRPSLAEGALYSYSKGGSEVTGPSIRLAEAIAQSWGNLQFGIRELDQRNGESTVEAYAWDVENNTRQVKVFQVPHLRYTRKGSYKLEDPRDVYELVANQGARRLRACILGVIPGDVIESAVRQCEVTLNTSADTSPEAVKKMMAAFGEFGVTSEMIQQRIQCRPEAIRPAQIVQMKKIYASLRDGMSSASEWFEGDFSSGKPVQAEESKTLPIYPEEKFTANFPSWEKNIKSGKKTAADFIAKLRTTNTLTDEQLKKLNAVTADTIATEQEHAE